jgi:hypothetical protein
MLLRSSTNCFAAASISMQQFHQTWFIRKTFCQRLIERSQTESMLPGERDKIAVGDLICAWVISATMPPV